MGQSKADFEVENSLLVGLGLEGVGCGVNEVLIRYGVWDARGMEMSREAERRGQESTGAIETSRETSREKCLAGGSSDMLRERRLVLDGVARVGSGSIIVAERDSEAGGGVGIGYRLSDATECARKGVRSGEYSIGRGG